MMTPMTIAIVVALFGTPLESSGAHKVKSTKRVRKDAGRLDSGRSQRTNRVQRQGKHVRKGVRTQKGWKRIVRRSEAEKHSWKRVVIRSKDGDRTKFYCGKHRHWRVP